MLCLAAGGLLVWAGDRRWAAVSLGVLVPLSLVLAPYFSLPAATATPASPGLRILQFNAAQRPAEILGWLKQHADEVDVAVLLEASTVFEPGLNRLREQFPHSFLDLRDGAFGLAVLSRYPLANTQTLNPIGEDFPALTAQLQAPGWSKPLTVYAVHPPPPVSRPVAKLRNDFLLGLAAYIKNKPGEQAVIVGDFNATPWSPWLRKFLTATDLIDSQRGLGLLSTWPASTAQYSAVFGIPIDLCLHTRTVQITRRFALGNLGSDHLPVMTEIAANTP